jgi:heme-degrading monooxygenase HmoA
MATMIVRHNVEDFAKFKVVFDQHAGDRRAAGSQGSTVFRGANNEVVVMVKWHSLEAAQAFAQSDSLHAAMQEAGVTGAPTVYFVEKVADGDV